jgi:hypothetical protein
MTTDRQQTAPEVPEGRTEIALSNALQSGPAFCDPPACLASVRPTAPHADQQGPVQPLNDVRRCCGRHHERGDSAHNRGPLGDSAIPSWPLLQRPSNVPGHDVYWAVHTCGGVRGRRKCRREGGRRDPGSAPFMATSSGNSALLEANPFCRTQQRHGPPPLRSRISELASPAPRVIAVVQVGLRTPLPDADNRTVVRQFHPAGH